MCSLVWVRVWCQGGTPHTGRWEVFSVRRRRPIHHRVSSGGRRPLKAGCLSKGVWQSFTVAPLPKLMSTLRKLYDFLSFARSRSLGGRQKAGATRLAASTTSGERTASRIKNLSRPPFVWSRKTERQRERKWDELVTWQNGGSMDVNRTCWSRDRWLQPHLGTPFTPQPDMSCRCVCIKCIIASNNIWLVYIYIYVVYSWVYISRFTGAWIMQYMQVSKDV